MSAEKFFEGFKSGLFEGMNTCAMARIERIDLEIMQADIIVFPGEELVLNVPVHTPQTAEFIIRVPHKVGDLGFVVFAQSEIDGIMYGGIGETSGRIMEVDDAIFVGGINRFNEKMPAGHEGDLIIAKKDFASKIVLKSNNDVVIHTDGNVLLGGESATEGVALGDTLKAWLDGHTHPIAWTDSDGNGESSAPSAPSPLPSKKVRTV